MIKEFIVSSAKPIPERMIELLRLFEDDIIQVEEKKFRLNHFRELKQLEFNSRGLGEGVLGRSEDSVWIMAFKNKKLTEEDVTEFARECKKYRNKLQQKIIISLDEIDINARLRALDEKILTWGLSQVNELMDLYAKPRIVT